MIRTYSVAELEQLSGIGRRSIGDYVSKGLLSGPSHRGRGARYPQADLDALLVIPRLRTLFKSDYPNIRSVGVFLLSLSSSDLRRLAKRSNERAFALEVRRLRVRASVVSMFPALPPEAVDVALEALTPEQVTGIDSGRYQIGSVLNIAELNSEPGSSDINGGGSSTGNGSAESNDRRLYAVDIAPVGGIAESAEAANRNAAPPQLRAVPKSHTLSRVTGAFMENGISERMQEMTQRLERIERLLAVDK